MMEDLIKEQIQKIVVDPRAVKFLCEQGTWGFRKRFPQYVINSGELRQIRIVFVNMFPEFKSSKSFFAEESKRSKARKYYHEHLKQKWEKDPVKLLFDEGLMAHFREEYKEERIFEKDIEGFPYPFEEFKKWKKRT